MLDLRFILENIDSVRQNCQQRQMSIDLDSLVTLAERRKELIQQVEEIRRRQNEVARAMKGKLSPEERQPLIEEGRSLKEQLPTLEEEQSQVKEELTELQRQIPNMTHPAVPVGSTDEENAELKRWGEIPRYDFQPLDHVELGERLQLIDWESGSRVTGSKFYFLCNEAVLLESALIRFALETLRQEGFRLYSTPDLARAEIVEGIGFNPRGEEAQIYSIEKSDLCLIATAEITLGGMHQGEILVEEEMPLRLAGLSHCFRTEAGAHGRASRGLYRVHQFTKVEMFAFTTPEQSDDMLAQLLALEEKIFQNLEIPYRVVDCCTGDLGAQAYRKFDIEAWMPGRGEMGEWGEVTSASNCTDYQARRLQIRYRKAGEKRPIPVHTLNGTALAISRALVALLEIHQQPDGSIHIPAALQPYTGFDTISLPKI